MNKPTAAQVREWAKNNGIAIGARGRIKPEIFAAYFEANPDPGATPTP